MAIVTAVPQGRMGEVALHRAFHEARLRQQPLHLVSSVDMPQGEREMEDFSALQNAEHERLVDFITEFGEGLECHVAIPRGPSSLSTAVLDVAEQVDASLIVIAVRRRSPVGKLVLGSTSQDVLLHAESPVLAVKLPEEVRGGKPS